MMKPLKQFLREDVGIDASFQIIGDIIIISGPDSLKKEDAERILEESGAKTVCLKEGGIAGEMREPSVRKVAGNGTETVHKENGCKYMLDVTKVMFSKGNVNERQRPARLAGPGEAVVDMFCGIGYFSVPIAKRRPTSKIYALDINPIAIKYLMENCRLNKIKNIKAINEDCRDVAKKLGSIADRIIMGYLNDTKSFLPSAFKFLKDEGGIIHYHFLSEGKNFEKEIKNIEHVAKTSGYVFHKILNKIIVKSYSPKMWHCVVDSEFRKNSI